MLTTFKGFQCFTELINSENIKEVTHITKNLEMIKTCVSKSNKRGTSYRNAQKYINNNLIINNK